MSGVEEQDFLIKLASTDSLRIAFRSHLELMTAVRQDKDDLRSGAQVRNRTLTALGLSAAALTPFIEQELVKSAKQAPQAAEIQPVSWLSRLPSFIRTRPFALGSGLMLGFAASTMLLNTANVPPSGVTKAPQVSTSQIPANVPTSPVLVPQTAIASPQTVVSQDAPAHETNDASRGLNSMSHSRKSVEAKLTTAASAPASIAQSGPAVGKQPVVTKSNPGRMSTNPLKFQKPNDSAKAK